MAVQVRCLRGGCDKVGARHCRSKGCGWVVCPTHRIIALTADQRKALGDA